MNSGLGALSSSTSRFHSASTTTTTTTKGSSGSHLQPASSNSNLRSRASRASASNSNTPSSSRPASVRSNVSRNSYRGSSTNDGGSATSTTPSKAGGMKRSTSTSQQRQNLLIPEGWEGGWSKLSNIANSVLNVDILGIGTESAWRSELERRDGGKNGDDSGSLRNRSKARSGETNGSGRGEVYSRTKRRNSDAVDNDAPQWDFGPHASTKRATSPPPDQTGDRQRVDPSVGQERLVYIHRVRPTDTFEGLQITYGISAAALRKANRLWPGDSIQARHELFLPTNECFVRGDTLTPEEALPLLNPSSFNPSSTSATTPTPTPSVSGLPTTDYPEPHSYLKLPSIPTPIPITRLSSTTLTYFPPHRPHLNTHARTNSSISTTSLTTPPDTPTGILPPNVTPGSFPIHAHIPDPNASALQGLNLNLNLNLPELHFHQAEESIGKALVVANEVGRKVEGLWRTAWGRDSEDSSRRGIELGSLGNPGRRRGGGEGSEGGGVSNTSSRVGRERGEGRRRRQRAEGAKTK